MGNKNKSLKISARIFGSLNAFIYVGLFLTFSKISAYLPQVMVDFVSNNFSAILITAYLLLLISIIAALSVTKRQKQEKYNVFFVYLSLTVINLFAFMMQYSLSNGFSGPFFG